MSEIDNYLDNVPEVQKVALQRVRETIKKTSPEAEEVISYGMPAFKYKGKYLIAYAPFKSHLSVFPGAGAIAALKSELSDFQLSKGTVQFTLETPLPDETLAKLVQFRMADIDSV